MIYRILYIIIMDFATFGGGAVYIPVYETYYVSLFNIATLEEFQIIVAIMNAFPGVTGGKLAGLGMFMEFGPLGLLIGAFIPLCSGVTMVFIAYKFIDKIKETEIFKVINIYIKPVVAGILLSLGYRFINVTFTSMNIYIFSVLFIIFSLLIFKYKTNIFYLICGGLFVGLTMSFL